MNSFFFNKNGNIIYKLETSGKINKQVPNKINIFQPLASTTSIFFRFQRTYTLRALLTIWLRPKAVRVVQCRVEYLHLRTGIQEALSIVIGDAR